MEAALTFNLKCIGTKWLLKPTLFCFHALAVCFWCNFGKFWLQRPWETTLFIFMSEGLLSFFYIFQSWRSRHVRLTCQANMSGSSLGFGQKCTFAQCQWNRAEDRNQGDSSKAHDRLPWLKRNTFSVTAPTRQTWSFCSALLGYKYMQNCSFNSRISKQTCNIKSEVFLYNRVLVTVSSSLRHRRLSKKSRVRQPQQMQHLPVHSLTRCKNKHCWLQWSIDPLCSCIRDLRKSC